MKKFKLRLEIEVMVVASQEYWLETNL